MPWPSKKRRTRESRRPIELYGVAASTHNLHAKAMGLPVPVTLQPQNSLLSREIEWEIIPAALHNGIGLLPWSPLAGGFLTGKYQHGGAAPSGTRAGSEKLLYQLDFRGIC
jgi:aryl-alcohol dehydrogenase-like predicted oxidoreductase